MEQSIHTIKNRTMLSLLAVAIIMSLILSVLGTPRSQAFAQTAVVWRVDLQGRITKNGAVFPFHGGNWFGLEGRHEPSTDPVNPSGAPMEQYLGNTFWASNHSRTIAQTMNEIKAMGINVIRLPLSPQTLNATDPQGMAPNLKNDVSVRIANSRLALETMIKAAAAVDIQVLLDIHSCSNYVGWRKGRLDARPPYVDATRANYDYKREDSSCAATNNPAGVTRIQAYDETKWLADLKTLAGMGTALGVNNIIGIDIYNEPWDYTWAEWKTLSEHAYTAINTVNPNILIFVEGVSDSANNQDGIAGNVAEPHGNLSSTPNWGENLFSAGPNLPNIPRDRLVFSPHTYGPSVAMQPMFVAPGQPQCAGLLGDAIGDAKCNLAINATILRAGWQEHFGYLKDLGYAVVLGEFGGNMDWPNKANLNDQARYSYLTDKMLDQQWQNALVDYMISKGIEGTYWSINPESGDTAGIYGSTYDPVSNPGGWGEWTTFDTRKTSMLQRLWAAQPNATPTGTSTTTPTQLPSTNLALGKPVTCSSVEAGANICANAVDGTGTTRWSSLYADPQWIRVDLGASKAINRVVLRWEAAYGKSYQIQTSNDDVNWTTIFSTTTGDGAVDDLSLTGTGRYVRMSGTVRGTSWGYSLFEFEVYGPTGPTSTATSTATITKTSTITNTPTVTLTGVISPTRTMTSTPTRTSTATVTPTNPPSTGLKVQYRAGDINTGDNQARPYLIVVNSGTSSVALSGLKIRYYFAENTSQAFTSYCDYATLNCANITTGIASMPAVTGADHYLEVSFTSGNLAAGANTGEIQTRFNKNDWSNLNESDDYSFDATKTAFADWTKVTLYNNGVLVWGTPPGGANPTNTVTPTATKTFTVTPTATGPTATFTKTATVTPTQNSALFTGNATHFDSLGAPYGGCGLPEAEVDSTNYVALNVQNTPGDYTTYLTRPIAAQFASKIGFFNNGLNCGRWVRVTISDFCTGINDGAAGLPFCRNGAWVADQYNGATLDMVVTDSCQDGNAWCRDDANHLDLATSSLTKFVLNGQTVDLTNKWGNRHINWQFISAPNYTGDIRIGFMQGAEKFWTPIAVTHLANGIHGVEYFSNGAWVKAGMNSDMGQSYLIQPIVSGGTQYQIRAYDVNDVLIQNGRTYTFGFPASCGAKCTAAFTQITYTNP